MLGPPRVWALGALAAYSAFLAWIVLSPSPAVASDVVLSAAGFLAALGLPGALVDPGVVEFALNAAMFAPLTVLASLVWPARRWTDWLSGAFLASLAVEAVQAVVLDSRSAQFVDVVANTLGGGIGAGIATIAAGLWRQRHANGPAAGRP